MPQHVPFEITQGEVIARVQGRMGLITLNRPRALNALSLGMIRSLTAALRAWADDPQVLGVAMRGMGKAPAAAVAEAAQTPSAAEAGQAAKAAAATQTPPAAKPVPAAKASSAALAALAALAAKPAAAPEAVQAAQPPKPPPSETAFQPFGAFCAGGDIRFFHTAALAGDPALDDFFTEEYTLNHLIHRYAKPCIAFIDGIVMGGGMGLCQGASQRIATERTQMAMPETGIGLFPDVGGGYFLSRCPGHWGEWLALTGQTIGGAQAVALGLADGIVPAAQLPALWDKLAATPFENSAAIEHWVATQFIAKTQVNPCRNTDFVQAIFSLPSVADMVAALSAAAETAAAETSTAPHKAAATTVTIAAPHNAAATTAATHSAKQTTTAIDPQWAQTTLAILRKRSPLMLHVTLEHIRRARGLSLADDLRMERDLVRHCFCTRHLGRSGAASETVEGIRALAVDKDHSPRWQPSHIQHVTPDMVQPFFQSPWPAWAHPLRGLD